MTLLFYRLEKSTWRKKNVQEFDILLNERTNVNDTHIAIRSNVDFVKVTPGFRSLTGVERKTFDSHLDVIWFMLNYILIK